MTRCATYLQLKVFSFDDVDTYPGNSCMSSLSITKQMQLVVHASSYTSIILQHLI